MKISSIKNEDDYHKALKRIDSLFGKKSDELDVLIDLVELYELKQGMALKTFDFDKAIYRAYMFCAFKELTLERVSHILQISPDGLLKKGAILHDAKKQADLKKEVKKKK